MLDAPPPTAGDGDGDDASDGDGALMRWLREEDASGSDAPVCVTFGSMAVGDAQQLTRLGLACLVAAVVRCGRRCLFLTGWGFSAARLVAMLDSVPALRAAAAASRLLAVVHAPHEVCTLRLSA